MWLYNILLLSNHNALDTKYMEVRFHSPFCICGVLNNGNIKTQSTFDLGTQTVGIKPRKQSAWCVCNCFIKKLSRNDPHNSFNCRGREYFSVLFVISVFISTLYWMPAVTTPAELIHWATRVQDHIYSCNFVCCSVTTVK